MCRLKSWYVQCSPGQNSIEFAVTAVWSGGKKGDKGLRKNRFMDKVCACAGKKTLSGTRNGSNSGKRGNLGEFMPFFSVPRIEKNFFFCWVSVKGGSLNSLPHAKEENWVAHKSFFFWKGEKKAFFQY